MIKIKADTLSTEEYQKVNTRNGFNYLDYDCNGNGGALEIIDKQLEKFGLEVYAVSDVDTLFKIIKRK